MFERVKQAAQKKMEKNLTEKCEKMRKYSRKKKKQIGRIPLSSLMYSNTQISAQDVDA
jgi:hypothetical protein